MIKFFYNGIKVDGGRLQKACYSFREAWGKVPTQMTIYAKEYRSFSKELYETFKIQNDTNIMTDYFEQDRIRIQPSHERFAEVTEAYVKQEKRTIKLSEKRNYDPASTKASLAEFQAKYC